MRVSIQCVIWREASITAYAKTKNLKIWLWVHSREVKDPEARKAYFRKVADAGMVGIKIDFPPASNRWWSNWYHDTARDAASFHLMLDFHGAVKPTGTERTWPNVLTREGVRGHEYHITRYRRRLEADHDVILPFTRYVAGAGDYTPTVFEPKELQGNTWGHELAQAVLFTSPYLCFGGHPKDYLANPARTFSPRSRQYGTRPACCLAANPVRQSRWPGDRATGGSSRRSTGLTRRPWIFRSIS
ncbi:MAG: glycoside hydrolase family 97 catalytic domain-containing protein [Candidatus Solibacter sp.]